MRDLRGKDLSKIDPPPTDEERAFLQRAGRFYEERFGDEVRTPAQTNADEKKGPEGRAAEDAEDA